MRVYTRGVEQGLLIGETVQVNVLEVQADCVRLAIIDPDASPTYREEVLYLASSTSQGPLHDRDSVFEPCEEFTFEDEDSRLIPMA